jgi:hypothetical protein
MEISSYGVLKENDHQQCPKRPMLKGSCGPVWIYPYEYFSGPLSGVVCRCLVLVNKR